MIVTDALAAAPEIPGSAVPGRQNEQPMPQPGTGLPSAFAPPPSEQSPPPHAGTVTLTLRELTIEGAKAIDPASLSDLWQPYLDKDISAAQIYDIANAITRRYAEAGYIISFAIVPKQEITDGKVTIAVVEGFVDEIKFSGDLPIALLDPASAKNPQSVIISRLARKILKSRPLKESDLEHYLLSINDLPGVTARATFAASKNTQGASTITVNITRETVSADINLDNHLPYYLGRWNAASTATANGFINGADSLSLTAGCGIYCNVYHMASARWTTPIGASDLKFSVLFNTSYDAPETGLLKTLSFYGRDTELNFSLDYLLTRTRLENLSIGTTLGGANAGTWTSTGQLTRDQTRTIDSHVNYEFADDIGGSNLAHVAVVQGLPIAAATNYNDPFKSRLYGDSTFTVFQANFARTQQLGSFWNGLNGFSIYALGSMQIDFGNPLLSASQCTYGGSIGRGYDSGALSGDHCAMGLLELRHDTIFENILIQPYVAVDAGAAWEKGQLAPGEPRMLGAESLSAGMRFIRDQWFSSDLSVAEPLRASVAEQGEKSPRFFLSFQAHL